jgi:transcriptional regulator with XRE-family HTH domain
MPPPNRRGHRAVHAPGYRAFLKRLRQARKEAGLSQAQAAKALRRPQTFLSKSEIGERRVDVVELAQFAKLYRKPLRYFVPGE